MDEPLFFRNDLSAALEGHRRSIRSAVEDVPEDQFLSSTDAQVQEHLISRLRLEPLTVYEDRAERTLKQGMRQATDRFIYDLRQGETLLVPSLELTLRLPYSGPQELWSCKSSMSLNPPRGSISSPDRKTGIGFLTMTASIDAQTQQPEVLEQTINGRLQQVLGLVAEQTMNIDRFNRELPALVSEQIAWRRKNFERLVQAAEKLKISIALKTDAPPLQPIAIEKRLVKALPPATKSAAAPAEPGIDDATYELILRAIRNQGRQFERTPATYAVHPEEELRDILWGNLATHFGKDVNGEAFSRSGKTDIRIEEDGRAAFIAECKVWRGPKELQAAVDQLLGYLRWRDCKTALIVFNKERGDFSGLLQAAPSALQEAKLYRGDAKGGYDAGECRMVFASPDDESRRVTVHVFLFNLFLAKANK